MFFVLDLNIIIYSELCCFMHLSNANYITQFLCFFYNLNETFIQMIYKLDE